MSGLGRSPLVGAFLTPGDYTTAGPGNRSLRERALGCPFYRRRFEKCVGDFRLELECYPDSTARRPATLTLFCLNHLARMPF
jgi:hypothetical protein